MRLYPTYILSLPYLSKFFTYATEQKSNLKCFVLPKLREQYLGQDMDPH